MVQINFGQREVSCKLVYYGPGMSGKTTNLEIIHLKAPETAKGEMVSIATETDRTLYFDFLPLDLGQVAGMHTKFQLYTVPGQVYYNATRKLVLQGVDGVIFVADSNPEKMQENIESLQNLRENLAGMGIVLDELPFVLQYNKRDWAGALPVAEMDRYLNPNAVPTVEAIARDGKGVFPTLKEISKLVIERLNRDHAPSAQRRRTAGNLGGSGSRAAPAPAQPTPSRGVPLLKPQHTPSRPAPVLPPRQATPARPAAALPPQQPTPVRPAAALPPRPAATRPAGPRAAAAAPPAAGGGNAPANVRERHLAKAKPPALAERRGQQNPVDLGPTDPHLRRYKQGHQGGGAIKWMVITVLGLLLALIVFSVLVVLVKPIRDGVRPLLPEGLQRLLEGAAEPASSSFLLPRRKDVFHA